MSVVACLLAFGLSGSASAQEVGDRVRLQSSNLNGVPVHPGPGVRAFVRWENGTTGIVEQIDPDTRWRKVVSNGDSGWVVRKYITVIPEEEPDPPGEEQLAYVVGTWNLEHFSAHKTRGFPENTFNSPGPTYGPRSDDDLSRIAGIIRDQLRLQVLVLNEINGVRGERRSEEMDALVAQLGDTWVYELTLAGEDLRQAVLYDSEKVQKLSCIEFEIPFTPAPSPDGPDIFARDPLACHLKFLENGQGRNDFIVVAVHLKSGQFRVENHNAAMIRLVTRLGQAQLSGDFPDDEKDVLIAGDFNASPYDAREEDFWTGLGGSGLKLSVLAPADGNAYHPTRLAGVPLAPRSQIDFLMASTVAGGLKDDLIQTTGFVHADLLVPHGFDDFREHVSDHLPVTFRVRVVNDDDP